MLVIEIIDRGFVSFRFLFVCLFSFLPFAVRVTSLRNEFQNTRSCIFTAIETWQHDRVCELCRNSAICKANISLKRQRRSREGCMLTWVGVNTFPNSSISSDPYLTVRGFIGFSSTSVRERGPVHCPRSTAIIILLLLFAQTETRTTWAATSIPLAAQ